MTDKLMVRVLKWLETQSAGRIISADSIPDSVRDDATHAAVMSVLLRISREADYAGTLKRTGVGIYRKAGAPAQDALPFPAPAPEARRLTPAEENAVTWLFAAGASDRQVASAINAGVGTANRAKHRLADRIEKSEGIRHFARVAIDAIENGGKITLSDGSRSVTLAKEKP